MTCAFLTHSPRPFEMAFQSFVRRGLCILTLRHCVYYPKELGKIRISDEELRSGPLGTEPNSLCMSHVGQRLTVELGLVCSVVRDLRPPPSTLPPVSRFRVSTLLRSDFRTMRSMTFVQCLTVYNMELYSKFSSIPRSACSSWHIQYLSHNSYFEWDQLG